jgi:4-carboxymuconolactone decarboxylase
VLGEKIMSVIDKSSVGSSASAEVRFTILPDRMPPIPTEKMTDAQRKAAAELCAGPRGKVEGPYWTIIRSPGYMEHIQKVGAYFRYFCSLDRRINEMAALMTARSWTQQFVWDVHINQALAAGLAPSTTNAIAEGRRPTAMAEDEEILHDFVTELLTNKSVSDPTYSRAVSKFEESGVIEILGIVGYYTTLAMMMNVSRTPLLDKGPLPLRPTPELLR